MSEIKKLLFDISEKGNPMCKAWLDDVDVTKSSDCTYFALPNQAKYLFGLAEGNNINVAVNNKGYKNVIPPDMMNTILNDWKTSENSQIQFCGNIINNMWNNCVRSIEAIRYGDSVHISVEEANARMLEYMSAYTHTYNMVLNFLRKCGIPAVENLVKVLISKSDSTKPADIAEANKVVMSYVALLQREVITKNHYIIDIPEITEEPVIVEPKEVELPWDENTKEEEQEKPKRGRKKKEE